MVFKTSTWLHGTPMHVKEKCPESSQIHQGHKEPTNVLYIAFEVFKKSLAYHVFVFA